MQVMTIENLQIKGKQYPAGRLLNGLFSKKELELAWAETLEIIANSNGDPNLLFKIGKLPFIFKMNGDTSPEYASKQFEEYIEENIESLKEFKLAAVKDSSDEAEICNVPDFEIDNLKEIGIGIDRANEIMIFFKSLMFKEVRNRIQGLKNWNFIFENKSDSNDLIPAIGNEFDVKINEKNFEDFDRLIKRDMSSEMQIVDLNKEVNRLYEEDGENFEKFSKKMEFFLSATYAFNPKNCTRGRSIRLPHSMVHEDLFRVLAGKSSEYLKIIKRCFPDLYPSLIIDIDKIQSGALEPYHDPFQVGQETLRGISSAVQENNFMSDDRIVDMNNLLMKMAKDILIKRTADAKINDLKKRNLPYKAIEEEMRKQISFIPDFDLIFDAYQPNILDIFRSFAIFGEKLSDEINISSVGEITEIYIKLNERAEYLGKTNIANIFGLNNVSRPISSRLAGMKKDLKEYFAADPCGYTSSNLGHCFLMDSNYNGDFYRAINDEEIFSGLFKIAKNLNNLGSAYAIKILANWAKDDEKKIARVIENLFKTDVDYADVDETLKVKLFLFVKESNANIDLVIEKLLYNSESIVNNFKRGHSEQFKLGIFDAFEKEVVQRIFKELFDSPRQLTGIKSFKNPENFNKIQSLKEIEAEASIALAEPIYVDMSDCLPAVFMVKLLPVNKASENDFSWAVEISIRDFKGKPIYEKASGRFENLKFKFGFQGAFRDIFEEISVLASHRYFVRDCAEANTRRISDKIREIIDKNKASETEEDKTVGPRSSGALSVDISRQDKSDDTETKNRLSEKNVKSNIIIRKIINGKIITDEEVKDLLVFRSSNLGAGKNIYSRIPAEELIEWNNVGDLKAFIMQDECFVMTTLAHSQAAGFYVKGFESDAGNILYGISPKKPTEYSKLAHEEYLNSGFNPVSVSPYKSKLSVRADGNVEVGTAKISLEGSDEIMVETMAVRESLNRQIAKKTASAEFIDDWVSEQIRVFKIENPNASDADLDNFIEEQVKVLSENKVLDSETVKLFLPGKYETQRVFNQGVYKKLSEVFGKE